MSVRRLMAAAGVALAALLLSGCATIPESGPVQTTVPEQDLNDNPAGFVANGPQDGMSAADVVSGFIRAQGAGGDYTVAKEFLTTDGKRDWQPDTSVLVQASSWTVDTDKDGLVRLSIPAVAEVGSTGRYTSVSGSPTREFQLQRVRGQWRISDAPDGVILSYRAFLSLFGAVQLQFFDPGYTRLVPDVRWFPGGGSTAASAVRTIAPSVVRAVLAGQSPLLAQVTVPVFPSGTELAAPVRTVDGVVTVSVRVPGSALDTRATDRIQQALAQSLVVSTPALHLIVNGREAPTAQNADLQQPAAGSPVVVAAGRFGALTAQGTVSEDRDLGPEVVKLKPRAITISAQRRLAAVLTGKGQVAIVGRDSTKVVDTRPGLIAPTMDQRGWTYSVSADDPSALRAYDPSGHGVDVGALGGTSVLSIEASTDGTRLLVLRQTDDGQEAYVAGILRDSDGTPVGVTADRDVIPLQGANAVNATWIDPADVAVLTQNATVQNVITQQLGGIAAQLPSPLANAEYLVGATRLQDLRAVLSTGALLIWSGDVWEADLPVSVDVDVLAVQR